MNTIEYQLIRSDRKTVGLQIKNGVLTVRAPRRLSEKRIEEIVAARHRWIEKHLDQTLPSQPPFTEDELEELTAQAKEYIPARVARFAALIGTTFGKVKIVSISTSSPPKPMTIPFRSMSGIMEALIRTAVRTIPFSTALPWPKRASSLSRSTTV